MRNISLDMCLSCEGQPDVTWSLQLPATVWLVQTTADTETFAELLLGGSLSFMSSKQISRTVDNFNTLISSITDNLNVAQVEVQNGTASLYAQSGDGSRLAFLIKQVSGGVTLEGRGEDKELLAGVLEEIHNIILVE